MVLQNQYNKCKVNSLNNCQTSKVNSRNNKLNLSFKPQNRRNQKKYHHIHHSLLKLPLDKTFDLMREFKISTPRQLEFLQQFPSTFLQFLIKTRKAYLSSLQNFNENMPQSCRDLMLCCYFTFNHINFKKYDILLRLVININQQIPQLRKINQNSISTPSPIQLQQSVQVTNCICNINAPATEQCFQCLRKFHTQCLKFKPIIPFICPFCTIKDLDPLNPIVYTLKEPQLYEFNSNQNQKNIQFIVPKPFQDYSLEVRCLRFDGKEGLNEITWPDKGNLQFNRNVVMHFKPIQQQSSLKKRKDEKYTTREGIQFGNINEIIITEDRCSQVDKNNYRINQLYGFYIYKFNFSIPCLIGVYMVKQLNPDELINLIKKNEKCHQSIEQSKNFIMKLNNVQSEELKWQGSTYSLTCVFDQQLIETPARGGLCNHVQCFSLENQIRVNQNSQRKWRCPICKQKCFHFIVDKYQKTIIQIIKNQNIQTEQISFDQQGQIQDETLKEMLRISEQQPQNIILQDQMNQSMSQMKQDDGQQQNESFLSKKQEVQIIEID